MSFTHLHVHSQYSLLEACARTKDLGKRVSEMGMPAVALTDSGNMFGAVEFYLACKEAGVKPIVGMDAYIAPNGRLVKGGDRDAARIPNSRIVLLAKNFNGYQSLCKISTIGYQEGFYYKPRIDHEVLKEHNEDLIALSGGLRGDVPFTFLEQGPEKALEKIRMYQEIYPDNFYLEMNRNGRSEWEEINKFLVEASKITGAPLVATNDVHYLDQDDSFAQEVLICIGTNKTLQDETRFKLGSNEFYLKDAEAMKALFSDVPEAVERTLEITEKCNIEFKFKDAEGKPIYHLPTFPTKDNLPLKDEMRRIAEEGLELRLKEKLERNEEVTDELRQEYTKRLDYELGVIDGMGFNGYFLIVQDFIGWAKDRDIPVGPGRGSGAGSLVAYSLKITDLDPMPYSLIFERFLNPERVSMPDFDVDFCQDRRQEVIQYVSEKYSEECVSQIITFGKLQARAALRDVGRVLGMTFSEVDVIAKLMPDKLGITLGEAIKQEPRLREMMEDDPKIASLMELAQRVEGLTRHASIHAAGVIISDRPLVEHAPLYKGVEGENVVQYDMKNAEKIGLIKFDFLGLKTLTHISDALKHIQKNRGKKVATKEISLTDPGIYKIMSRGDTAGIFQFEGEGISELIRKVQPSRFEDITAINALYRPGPMQQLDEYVGRKKGDIKVTYLFDDLEPILKETYGIIVYQEQVQLIAAKIGSYSLGEADLLRRAMGKKIAAEMNQQRARFLKGAKENGYDQAKASELFDLMAKFAEYGFNKSHAAAYCVVAAYTAWLKAYYPVEFFAALLSTEISDTDKVVKYVKDARKHGIEVCPPHVNVSEHKFTVSGEKIFFGLGAIKGVGQSAVEAILEARQEIPDGKFESLEGFFNAVDLRRVNKKVIECLIRAGALDEFGYSRAQLMEGFAQFVDRAEKNRQDKEVGQGTLFDMIEDETEQVVMPDVPAWGKNVRLAHEKEVLGFYLSDHPLSGMDGVFAPWTSCQIVNLKDVEHRRNVRVGGIITTLREMITRKGTRMAFATLEDTTGAIELLVFPDAFEKFGDLLSGDEPLVAEGIMEREGGTGKIRVESLARLESLLGQSDRMVIELNSEKSQKFEELKSVLLKHPGKTEVIVRLGLPELKRTVFLNVSEPKGVGPGMDFFEKMNRVFGTTDFVRLERKS